MDLLTDLRLHLAQDLPQAALGALDHFPTILQQHGERLASALLGFVPERRRLLVEDLGIIDDFPGPKLV